MTNEQCEDKKCCCTACKIVKCILVAIITIASITGAIFSYKSYSLLNALSGGASAQAAETKTITEKYAKNQTMEKALKSGKPVVALFYADWCGYCKKFAPTFNKLSKNRKFKKNFAVAYVNEAENRDLLNEYDIKGFPTVYFINNGEKTELSNSMFFVKDADKKLLEHLMGLLGK